MSISLGRVIIEYTGVNLRLTRNIITKVEEDNTLVIETIIENKSFLPVFNLILKDSLSCASSPERSKLILVDYLGAKSSLNIKYSCICPKRGRRNLALVRD